MRTRRAIVLLLALVITLHPARLLAKPLAGLAAESCFNGVSVSTGVYPITVRVFNGGDATDGNIVVQTTTYSQQVHRYLYPISLPTGSTKQLTVYPNLIDNTDQIRVHYEGPHDQSFPEAIVPMAYGDPSMQSVGLIGDKIGGMAAMRAAYSTSAYSNQNLHYSDCYAAPELAPDRASGYESLAAVVLADGAERMNPAQWAALHQWVVSGGTVILLGGANASFLKLADAAPLVPLVNIRAATIARFAITRDNNELDIMGPVAEQTGDLKPGANTIETIEGHISCATERIGAGVVVFSAVNPLDKPIHSSPNVSDMWLKLVKLSVPKAAISEMVSMAEGTNNDDDYGRYSPRSYSGAYSGPPGYAYPYNTAQNPFKIKLPATSTISWLLFAYFIAAVPVTFFVLRKMKRLEWAWVTSPILSLLFAFGFYLFTAELYKASMSRRTSGVLTAEAGNPNARFSGMTDIFFPHGGNYQIAIDSAETLDANNGEGVPTGSSMETVDNGSVQIPAFSATNLAYRSLQHEQSVNWGGGVVSSLTRKPDGSIAATITNATGKPLRSLVVYNPSRSAGWPISDLSPGQTLQTTLRPDAPGTNAPPWAQQYFGQTPDLRAHSASVVMLLGSTDGDRFGPQLGKYAGAPGTVGILVSMPIREATP